MKLVFVLMSVTLGPYDAVQLVYLCYWIYMNAGMISEGVIVNSQDAI
jgi:hypothetical protein